MTRPNGDKPYYFGKMFQATWSKVVADSDASDVVAEQVLFRSCCDQVMLCEVFYSPMAAMTAHDTNNLSIVLRKYHAGSPTTLFTYTSTTTGGGFTDKVSKDLGLEADSVSLEEGDSVTFEITKAGTGVIMPAGLLSLVYTIS